jgi:hypothetical protein
VNVKTALDMAARFGQYTCWLFCALSLLQGQTEYALGAAAELPASSEPVQVIAARNIFAPAPPQAAAEAGKPAKTQDTLALVGTMSYEKAQMAFFDGSNPLFRQALTVGDNIGGWSVTAIDFNQVKLKAGTREVELAVGTCLVREEAGDWKFGGKADTSSPPAEIASQKVQAPAVRPPAIAANSGATLVADSEKYDRWAEKKMSKYLAGVDPEAKKDKKGDKTPDALFQDAPKKSGKRHKHDQG